MAVKQKGRKIGRNKDWCKMYRLSDKQDRSKALKLLRHFKRYGYASACAVHCYNNLPMLVKPKAQLTVTLTRPVGKHISPAQKMPPVRSRRIIEQLEEAAQ